MEAADNRPLEDRPEALNGLRVHRADNVLFGAVHDGLVRIFAKALVGNLLIGREQTNFGRNRLANEALQIDSGEAGENASDYTTLALYGTDNDGLKMRADLLVIMTAFGLVFVAAFSADERFVYLNNAHQLAELFILQGRADAMADVPSRLVRAEAHVALDLQGADALLRAKHQVDDLEPVAEIDLGVFENRADKVREAISASLAAIRALPFEFHRGERVHAVRTAARAMDALRPAVRHKVAVASLLIGEKLVKLARCQLLGFASHFSRLYIVRAA